MSDDRSWRESALCRQVSPDMWYPERGEEWRMAVRLCQVSCPVRWRCLRDTLAAEAKLGEADVFGIAGGFTPNERRAMLRKRWRRTGSDRKPRRGTRAA